MASFANWSLQLLKHFGLKVHLAVFCILPVVKRTDLWGYLLTTMILSLICVNNQFHASEWRKIRTGTLSAKVYNFFRRQNIHSILDRIFIGSKRLEAETFSSKTRPGPKTLITKMYWGGTVPGSKCPDNEMFRGQKWLGWKVIGPIWPGTNEKTMNRNWSNWKQITFAKLKGEITKMTNRQYTKKQKTNGSYYPEGGHSTTQTGLKV